MKYQGFYEITEYLISKLKDAGVLEVSIGSKSQYTDGKLNVTPSAHIAPIGATMASNNNTGSATTSLQVEVFIFEQVTGHKQLRSELGMYGVKNEVDALDSSMYILDKFIKSISRSFRTESGGYIRSANSNTFSAVLDQGADEVTGMLGTLSVTYTPGSVC